MTNVAGHLREQNGMYQMILSWKDTDGKRRTKSISTGLPVKGNKKRAESLLRKTQKEFNPETMQQVSDLPVSEYLNRWLRESVMNLPPETYGRYAYDLGRVWLNTITIRKRGPKWPSLFIFRILGCAGISQW